MSTEILTEKQLNEVQFVIGDTKHYPFCKYRQEIKDCPVIEGNVYEFHDIVSVQLNQLKAKLFNLIEATSTDAKQQEALKGLVKGFANTAYKNTTGDLTGLFQRLGFQVEDFNYGTNPLEGQN
jgi:hypothetical protein